MGPEPAPPDGLPSPAFRPPRVALRIATAFVLYPLALFLPAGRLDWVEGWVLVGILVATGGAGSAILKKRHPDLVAERARFTRGAGVKPWDRVLAPVVAVLGPLATYVVSGLDERFAWTGPLPAWVPILGGLLAAAGSALSLSALAANRFFSSVVRIQSDRGQTVVSDGPYRRIRHPGYAGGLAFTIGVPLLLGSIPGLATCLLTVGGLVLRTGLEDRTLRTELPGYEEYAAGVRWRLVPGIW